jgi:hypothetical protein
MSVGPITRKEREKSFFHEFPRKNINDRSIPYTPWSAQTL